MRILTQKEKRKKGLKAASAKSSGEPKEESLSSETKVVRRRPSSKFGYLAGLSILMFVIGSSVGLGSGIVIGKIAFGNSAEKAELAKNTDAKVLGEKVAVIGTDEGKGKRGKGKDEGLEFNEEATESADLEEASGPEGLRPGGEESKTVTVKETSTGFLRVRKSPGGLEIAKVYPGDTFSVVSEKSGWLEIELEEGSSGWISGQYASEGE